MSSTSITNGKVFYRGQLVDADILIEDGKISKVAKNVKGDEEVDAKGQLVLPGAIDVHVHFRDLQEAYKEDWYTGSCAAAGGGVTTVIDQPNTIPPTLTVSSYNRKRGAARASIIDYGINGGIRDFEHAKELCDLGITAFGEMFIHNKTEVDLSQLLQTVKDLNALACIHAEKVYHNRMDEVKAIEEILRVNKIIGARLHIAHVSTSAGVELIKRATQDVTCEVTPHHLLLSDADARRLGPFGIMNPPLRSRMITEALWSNMDMIDMIASDHAPHTVIDKKSPEPPPGVPGVETLVPLLLANLDLIGLKRFVVLTSMTPAHRFKLKGKGSVTEGNDADLILVDLEQKRIITRERLHSKADWTPFEGLEGVFPSLTMVRGEVVFDGDITANKGWGRQVFGTAKK